MTEIMPVQVGKIGFLTGRILNAVDEVIGVEGGLSGLTREDISTSSCPLQVRDRGIFSKYIIT